MFPARHRTNLADGPLSDASAVGRQPTARSGRGQRSRLRWLPRLALLALVAFPLSCAGPIKSLYPPTPGSPTKTVYLVRHAWHTGVVIKRADLPTADWAVAPEFPEADHLEFGWGDDAFYRAPRGTVSLALKAALWPSPSVLHVVGWQGTPRENFPDSEIVEVELSPQGWDGLAGFIDRTFERDANGRLMPLEKGLYGDSRFYRARGKFYFPKMCNQWSASALRAAGCPITRCYALNAANVIWQTRRFGRAVPFAALPAAPETPRSHNK